MFIKLVILLLLLIVVASLLTGKRPAAPGQPAAPRVRPLVMKMAMALLALGVAVAVIHLAGCSRESAFHATEVREAGYAPLSRLDGLIDHRGRRLASADFSGKLVVVFFGYTQCPDICPTALAAWKETMHLLGPDADRVQVLFVTVDPARDTPEILAAYVPWFDARFIGAATDEAGTREIAKAFHVFYSKVPGATALGYSIDHTATSYVFGTSGTLRLLVRDGTAPALIAEDLRRLLGGA